MKTYQIMCALLALAWSCCLFAAKRDLSTSLDQPQLNSAWQLFSAAPAQPNMTFPHQACFDKAAQQYNMPLALLLGLARGESDFNEKAVSSANAIGVMQIVWPATANDLGIDNKADLYHPCTNIDAGARYLQRLIKRYDGNIYHALAAYNYGPGRIDKALKRGTLPTGAHWYAHYIFDHTQFVVGTAKRHQRRAYQDTGRLELITFKRPYRARGFIEHLNRSVPDFRFDWFEKPYDRYVVVFHYESDSEKQQGIAALKRQGFNLDEK
ncbi:MAG: lytic transglycosylase [Kangiellaceae bacterium]|nr:lytic transglycosylase [Kangiellaceae bacterium]|tara:strand:- start:2331 stop:3131 length:801 start_codon:yes stop_codon:yes gene_type:complete